MPRSIRFIRKLSDKCRFPALFLLCLVLLPAGALPQSAHIKPLSAAEWLKKGVAGKEKDDFSAAMANFFTALKLAEKEKDSATIFKALFCIGEVHSKMDYQARALGYMKRALAIAEQMKDSRRMTRAFNGLGIIYTAQKKYDSAVYSFKHLIKIASQTNDTEHLLMAYNNMGSICIDAHDYQEAKLFYHKALHIWQKNGDSSYIVPCLQNLGEACYKLNQLDSALYFFNQASQMPTYLTPDFKQSQDKWLAQIYEKKGDYKAAYQNLSEHLQGLNSIFTLQSSRIVNELESKYQLEKKQREIALLNFEKKQKEAALREKEEKIEYRNMLLLLSIAILLLILVLFYLLFKQFKSREYINAVLVKKNTSIEEQKQQLESSLKYTQQLQAALQHDLNYYMQATYKKQMSPHFIFNSLNSVQRFILQNDKMSANNYLADFSQLMRRVLENSQKELVTVKEELETLQLYINLEQKRFHQKFDYRLNVDESIRKNLYAIPPFILQPYVENAIWHGLLHKNSKGVLQLKLEEEDGFIACSIIDNGIGRAAAGKRKTENSSHESLGTKITEKRIQAINYLNNTRLSVSVTDLTDANGNPAGTAVIIRFPITTLFNTTTTDHTHDKSHID